MLLKTLTYKMYVHWPSATRSSVSGLLNALYDACIEDWTSDWEFEDDDYDEPTTGCCECAVLFQPGEYLLRNEATSEETLMCLDCALDYFVPHLAVPDCLLVKEDI